MQMLRVWGGGIYEADSFYDICDELGLLVWQDFLFACGIYPAHPAFVESVRAEAEQAIRRLRHHPCLALWCGNNEDYSLAVQQGYTVSGPVTESFPGRVIYEQLLPEICGQLDPARPYWPGSPYGGADGSGSEDPRQGDQHVWDIWNNGMAPYQEYPRYGGRFVSEFGMIGLPSAATIARMASPSERYPGSRMLDFHLKAGDGLRRLAAYLAENVRTPADMAGYAYASQLVQAEAMATALRSWRRRFGGPGRYACGGALVWQLNDCWPAISWSIIDDALFPKMGYYAVRRALSPLALELERHTASGTTIVWAANSTGLEVTGMLQVRRWALSGELESCEERAVVLAPHRTTELGGTALAVDSRHVLEAELRVDGGTRARASLWAEPLKYLTVGDPGLTCESSGEGKLRLTCRTPAKGVWVESEPTVTWSDNGFDLFPGQPYEIEAASASAANHSACGLSSICSRIAKARSGRDPISPTGAYHMDPHLQGLHHVTSICGEPQRNIDFYTGILGLRLVKVTINFDDPESYHFYYGDGIGSPGTILTFFAWPGAMRGHLGPGQIADVGFTVPPDALPFWQKLADCARHCL